MSPRMRKLIRNVSIKIPSSNVLRIPGLIREFKHSNSNMRHWYLTSKGSLFFGTPCSTLICYVCTNGRLCNCSWLLCISKVSVSVVSVQILDLNAFWHYKHNNTRQWNIPKMVQQLILLQQFVEAWKTFPKHTRYHGKQDTIRVQKPKFYCLNSLTILISKTKKISTEEDVWKLEEAIT